MGRSGDGEGDGLMPFQTDGRSHPTLATLRGWPRSARVWQASTLLTAVRGSRLQTSLPFSLPHQGMVLNANDFQ